MIVTKDGDSPNLVVVHGPPPKVIWPQRGHCTTKQVENAFRANHTAIEAFGNNPLVGTISIQ